MKTKGYTLIEVILAIAIIGLIAAAFLPLITFSYTNLIGSVKFTEAMLEDQSIIEKQIDASRFSPPENPASNYVKAWEVEVPVHHLSVNTTTSGQVKLFLPEQSVIPKIPIIQSPPQLIVRDYSGNNLSSQPEEIHIFDDPYKLFVRDVVITAKTIDEHLMNVYRWYTTTEISDEESASTTTDDYVVLREWNEAKTVVPYSEALEKGFVPNMKVHTDVTFGKEQYNEFNYRILKNVYDTTIDKDLPLEERKKILNEQMINNFGNRYIRYGVTPFSLTGRMGKEELSNAIYIEAPRIEIKSAKFESTNKVIIEFKEEIELIEESISRLSIFLNENLGEPKFITKVGNFKLVLEFENTIDTSKAINGNTLTRGAVISKEFGAISIWYNNYPNAEFTISP